MKQKIRLLVDLPVNKELGMTAGLEVDVRPVEVECRGRGLPRWMYDHPDGVSIGIMSREAESVLVEPWSDVREQMDMIRTGNPASRPPDAGLVHNLLTDADALWVVARAAEGINLKWDPIGGFWILLGENEDAQILVDSLDALPEHLGIGGTE